MDCWESPWRSTCLYFVRCTVVPLYVVQLEYLLPLPTYIQSHEQVSLGVRCSVLGPEERVTEYAKASDLLNSNELFFSQLALSFSFFISSVGLDTDPLNYSFSSTQFNFNFYSISPNPKPNLMSTLEKFAFSSFGFISTAFYSVCELKDILQQEVESKQSKEGNLK